MVLEVSRLIPEFKLAGMPQGTARAASSAPVSSAPAASAYDRTMRSGAPAGSAAPAAAKLRDMQRRLRAHYFNSCAA